MSGRGEQVEPVGAAGPDGAGERGEPAVRYAPPAPNSGWPKRAGRAGETARPLQPGSLATELPAGHSLGWWGMVLLVTTEATLFAVLLGSYFYLRFQYGPQWPPPGIDVPALARPLVMTAVLVPSSLPVIWAERGARRGQQWRLRLGLVVTLVLGGAFLAMLASEYADLLRTLTWTTNVYGSLFYTVTGFHGLHVTIGLLMLGWLLAASSRAAASSGAAVSSGATASSGAPVSSRGTADHRWRERVRVIAIYWHFVDAVWVAILFTLYLSPRL